MRAGAACPRRAPEMAKTSGASDVRVPCWTTLVEKGKLGRSELLEALVGLPDCVRQLISCSFDTHLRGICSGNDVVTSARVLKRIESIAERDRLPDQQTSSDLCDEPLVRATGSGGHNRKTFTRDHVATFLWDVLVCDFDRRVRTIAGVAVAHAEPSRKRKKTPLADLDAVAGEAWEETGKLLCALLPRGDRLLEQSSVADCATSICDLCIFSLGVIVDPDLVSCHIAPVCIRHLEPTGLFALTAAQGEFMADVIGKTLASVLRRYVLATEMGREFDEAPNLVDVLRQELVAARAENVGLKVALAAAKAGERDPLEMTVAGDSLILRSAETGKKSWRSGCAFEEGGFTLHTAIVEYCMQNKIAFKNAASSIIKATEIAKIIGMGNAASADEVKAALRTDRNLRHHAVILDMALDLYTQERVKEAYPCTPH